MAIALIAIGQHETGPFQRAASWMRRTCLIHAVRAASCPFEISRDTPGCPKHRFRAIQLLSRFSVTRHTQNDPPNRSWKPYALDSNARAKRRFLRRSNFRVCPGRKKPRIFGFHGVYRRLMIRIWPVDVPTFPRGGSLTIAADRASEQSKGIHHFRRVAHSGKATSPSERMLQVSHL
jgi:hypothetical protein